VPSRYDEALAPSTRGLEPNYPLMQTPVRVRVVRRASRAGREALGTPVVQFEIFALAAGP
jgi:hypothetical protein